MTAIPTASPNERRLAIRRELARRSFAEFVRQGWHAIEPTRALLPSVAIDAMTAALQAVAEGCIRRLAIATCPGTSKSLLAAVAFPAWLLFRRGGTERVMVGSYSWDFAERDSRRCRDLLTSEWFRALVGDAWTIREDANTRADYWTTTGGRRLIVSPSGKALGERCTIQILDDVLSGADVHSPAAKREAIRWINEVLPSRLEDQTSNARVIVGQRLCVDDPISVAVEQGWRYLSLPATLGDDDAPCELRDDAGALVWRDSRALGVPIVSLLGLDALDRLRAELGSAAFAAQYQQRPRDDSGAIIKRGWWRFHRAPHVAATARRPSGADESAAVDTPTTFSRIVIACDLTFGSMKGDYAVAQVWGAHGGGRYLLEQWRRRAGFEESIAAIADLAARYPRASILVERAANGAAVIETLHKRLPNVLALHPQGSKAQRLSAIAPSVESGSCYLPLGATWLDEFAEELAGATSHDDAMDCAAYAVTFLQTRAALDTEPVAPKLFTPEPFTSRVFGGAPDDGPLYPNGVLNTLYFPRR